MSYVYDDDPIPQANKVDQDPELHPSVPANQKTTAVEFNQLVEAVMDLKAAILAGYYHGFEDVAGNDALTPDPEAGQGRIRISNGSLQINTGSGWQDVAGGGSAVVPVHFSASGPDSVTVAIGGGFHVLTGWTPTLDTHSGFNGTTGYVIPHDGWYVIEGQVEFEHPQETRVEVTLHAGIGGVYSNRLDHIQKYDVGVGNDGGGGVAPFTKIGLRGKLAAQQLDAGTLVTLAVGNYVNQGEDGIAQGSNGVTASFIVQEVGVAVAADDSHIDTLTIGTSFPGVSDVILSNSGGRLEISQAEAFRMEAVPHIEFRNTSFELSDSLLVAYLDNQDGLAEDVGGGDYKVEWPYPNQFVAFVTFPAGVQEIEILNAPYDENSIVFPVIQKNDDTMTSVRQVGASGSLILRANAAPTGDVRVGVMIITTTYSD